MNDDGSTSDRLLSDNPIKDVEDDTLGRIEAAKIFVRDVLSLDASEGAVVGLFGPWGSGKTSFVNLTRDEFKNCDATVVDFNPWMFSNSQQLVERFFTEIASQINIPKHRDLGIDMAEELKLLGGDLAVGAIGKVTHHAGTALKLLYAGSTADITSMMKPSDRFIVKILDKKWDKYKQYIEAKHQSEGWGVINRRRNIEKVLSALGEEDKKKFNIPIIVIIDDVDRLTKREIKDVFRLIRLTASFPNIIYIVPCDRKQVELALDGTYGIGRNYLEKIIQFYYNLPPVSQSTLANEIDNSIEKALSLVEKRGRLDREVVNEVLIRIVYRLIRSIRDVRRYAIAIRSTFSHLDGKIAQADVLALEAIRLFIPDVFNLLPGVIHIITVNPSGPGYYRYSRSFDYGYSEREDYSKQVAELFNTAGEERYIEPIVYMIKYIFPNAAPYIPELKRDEDSSKIKVVPTIHESSPDSISEDLSDRMARESVFRAYLKQVPLDEVEGYESLDVVLNRFVDAGRLREYLRSLTDEEFKEIMFRLNNDQPRFLPEHVEPGVIELSNRMFGVYGIRGIWTISHITEVGLLYATIAKLLKTFPNMDDEKFLRIFDAIESLSIKFWLMAELQKGDGEIHGLVSDSVLVEVKSSLCELIRNASIGDLAMEWYLPRFLLWSKDNCSSECVRHDDDPKFTFIVLWGLRSESSTGTIDQNVRRFTVPEINIIWEHLVGYYGQSLLRHRVENMCENFDQVVAWAESKGLAQEYAERLKELAEEWLRDTDNEEPR